VIDLRQTIRGRSLRLTNRSDADTLRFEVELLARRDDRPPDDEAGEVQVYTPIELPLPQRQVWLAHSLREWVLFQMRDAEGRPAMQAVVSIYRPRQRGLGGVCAQGMVHRLGPAATGEDEEHGLEGLRRLCAELSDLVTLRLQPRRFSQRALYDYEARARRAGYSLRDPEGITRTLVVDLSIAPEAYLASLTKKTRAKFRHRKRAEVEIRPLDDPRWIPACRAASAASIGRTGGESSSRMELEALFGVARERPELARIFGLFLPDRPDDLLAFVAVMRHGRLAEYTVAGSLFDPVLRSMPFNYFLLWELMTWARDGGSLWLDLGGITEGGSSDPLAGISSFKRNLTDNDVELGREMAVTLKPLRLQLLEASREARDRLGLLRDRWRARSLAKPGNAA
jgi:Acetyltransferase (GNAT) domain